MITTTSRGIALSLVILLSAGLCGVAPAETFHGHALLERAKNRPDLGFIELYEYKAFLAPVGSGSGFSYHCGDPGTAIHPYTGCITIRDVPPGEYVLFTFQANFFPRGKIVPNVTVEPGSGANVNAVEAVDYSGYHGDTIWDAAWAQRYFQTFVAHGTAIVRVSFRSPGGNVSRYRVSVRDGSGGGPVEDWPQVGPSGVVNHGSNSDLWVAWEHGWVATVPGQTYAVRIEDALGEDTFSLYWMDDAIYPHGTGYRNSQATPAGHDLCIAVFADNDGIITPCMILSPNFGMLLGQRPMWAQSFTAKGHALAGFAVYASNPDSDGGWQWTGRLTVRRGAIDGPSVGPTKIMPSAFFPFTGIVGCAYRDHEVPLTQGETYWIIIDPLSPGINPRALTHDFTGGQAAYWDGENWQQVNADLAMNIYEFADTDPTAPTPRPASVFEAR